LFHGFEDAVGKIDTPLSQRHQIGVCYDDTVFGANTSRPLRTQIASSLFADAFGNIRILKKGEHRNDFNSIVFFVFAIFVSWTGVCFSQNGSDLLARFLTEAPQKWREYRVFSKTIQGRITTATETFDPSGILYRTHKITLKDKKFLTKKGIFHVKQNAQSALSNVNVETFDFKTKSSQQFFNVSGANSRYAFELGKKPSSVDWYLKYLIMDPSAKIAADGQRTIQDDVFYQIAPHFLLLNQTLIEALEDKKANTFKEARIVKRDHGDCVEIRYETRKKIGSVDGPHRGTIILNPDQCWCVLENRIQTRKTNKYDETQRWEFEMTDAAKQFPVLKRAKFVEGTRTPDGQTIEGITIADYEFTEAVNPPDRDFTLSAFGLPEPEGVVWPRPFPWYLWFLAIGAVALGAGWYWRRRVLQRRELVANRPQV
jgi:hypothetical protein